MTTSTDKIIQTILKTKKCFSEHSVYSDNPGLYAFILTDKSNLKQFGKGGQIIYVGKAEDSLKKRDFKTHFNDKRSGNSTLRRSIGAIFKTKFNSTAFTRNGTLDKIAIDNYKFDIESESKLTSWMKQNLEIGYWEFDSLKENEILYDIEEKIIIKLRPTLDLDKRTKKYNIFANKLSALRQICKNEARHNAMENRATR
ncbi:MAG: hypothetical protein HY840_08295 [Bacteroidetes bacterium]|nr:hypothetical protein [Bacteroidota bacterium]